MRATFGTTAGVLAAVLLTGACGDGSDPVDDRTSAPATTAAPSAGVSPSLSAAPSPSPSRSASPSASPSAAPVRAADGTRYAACSDGTCEVAVRGKKKITFRRGTLSVTKFAAGKEFDFRLDLRRGGGGHGTLKGTCGSVAYFSGSGVRVVGCGASGVPQKPAPQRGEVALQLIGWTTDGSAVLRLATR